MTPEAMGHILRDVRVALRLALHEAAKLCDLNIVEFGLFERGKTPLSPIATLQLISKLLEPNRQQTTRRIKRLQKLVDQIEERKRK